MKNSPTIIEAVRLSEEYLRKHGVESARHDAERLLASTLCCERLDLYLRFEEVLAEGALKRYREDLRKRAGRYPLQYIIGEVEFFSNSFKVRENVFIPRPETELLIERIEDLLGTSQELFFIELGVGSGIISGSLASRHPLWRGVAFDIAAEAVLLARENFEKLGVSDRVCTAVASGFEAFSGARQFDLLVSNPPYVPAEAIDGLQEEVAKFEPRTALDGGKDGTDFYPILSGYGKSLLRPGGLLALEIAGGQQEKVVDIMKGNGYVRIDVMEDYNGLKRTVTGFRPEGPEGKE